MSEDVWREYRETGDLADLTSLSSLAMTGTGGSVELKRRIRERLEQDTALFGELAG